MNCPGAKCWIDVALAVHVALPASAGKAERGHDETFQRRLATRRAPITFRVTELQAAAEAREIDGDGERAPGLATLESSGWTSRLSPAGEEEDPMAGWLLVLGAVSFIVGAANPALGQVWSASLEAQLRLIADAATAWTVTNSLFLFAAVLTAAGLSSLPEHVGDRGLVPARAATIVYLVAATAWLASLVFRLTVTPDAASAFVASGSLDPTYVMTDRWAVGLFGAFTYFAGGSLIAIGVAVILGGALSGVSGWFAIVVGFVMVGGYAVFGDMPPFVAYLPTGLLGIVLLRKTSRADGANRPRTNEEPG